MYLWPRMSFVVDRNEIVDVAMYEFIMDRKEMVVVVCDGLLAVDDFVVAICEFVVD